MSWKEFFFLYFLFKPLPIYAFIVQDFNIQSADPKNMCFIRWIMAKIFYKKLLSIYPMRFMMNDVLREWMQAFIHLDGGDRPDFMINIKLFQYFLPIHSMLVSGMDIFLLKATRPDKISPFILSSQSKQFWHKKLSYTRNFYYHNFVTVLYCCC